MLSLPRSVSDYLQKCRSDTSPPLNSGSDSLQTISQAVVIPALAEKSYLFSTLASLARNDPGELERTLVICVINNRPYPLVSRESLQDNRETLKILQSLSFGLMPAPEDGDSCLIKCCREILQRRLRLAYLDASSMGLEMPRKHGGVGLARKWGMDAGLAVMDYESYGSRRLLCLDADSPVEANYLAAIRRFYEKHNCHAAVISYAHPLPEDQQLLAAICSYEIFLRYYVLGLNYAGSPYAFHTIGSTMSCTVRGYVAVRGMNRREAGEDFYFLNKLAKLSPMGSVSMTRVYPSARPSQRVPFGTGQRISDCLEGKNREDFFYDPQVFVILKQLLKGMEICVEEGGSNVMQLARDISPLLASFLERSDFPTVWDRICRTHKRREKRVRHFQEWFDAFQTMKLIHYLTEAAYPTLGLWQAVPKLLELVDQPLFNPVLAACAGNVSGLDENIAMLKTLRELEIYGDGGTF